MSVLRMIAAATVVLALSGGDTRADAISSFGSGPSRAAACQAAKTSGETVASRRGAIEEFGRCQCADDGRDGFNRWGCSVDVYYTPRSTTPSYGYAPYPAPAPAYGYGYPAPAYDPCLGPAAPPPGYYCRYGPWGRDSSVSAPGIK